MSTESALTAPPRRLLSAAEVRARHGEAGLDLLAQGLREGDPVADAVIAEFAESGGAARTALGAGLNDGLAALADPPPAVAALLRESEGAVAEADRDLLERGDLASLTVDPFWSRMAFALGSLVHTYSAPGIARVLMGTGKLTEGAARRLGETGLWRGNAILPGGLLRGAPGYVDTVQVRLLHARVRANALKRGWDVEEWGVPINQVDAARTWLDFTVVPFRALERVGIVLTPEEERDLYRYWRHIAALVGVDPRFYLDVHDHASAGALLDLIDGTNAAPDASARALVEALVDALVSGLMGGSLSLPEPSVRTLLAALTRLMQGDEAADALGIERVDVAPFLPLLAMGNSGVRRWQRATPESWRQALAEHTEYRRTEFAHLPGTEYRASMADARN
ncbi:hypothetical protein HDA32_005658 [Spinactinospora alkalitolerans]|uniref:ER-bound oxygenase mpaB/mpaB'/Rubber oxygenase catalytic domain-containing protein n=1 Tax=Spinactinospora alkalitolerans TaxID=687207 RepID=A0A852U2T3_9ACTN|nr:oxygenase MpaB family protein [Spinactinospora alkalitolerans]NYE50538.1 hypothetical protein [Spinactinospora alkalitolerans]